MLPATLAEKVDLAAGAMMFLDFHTLPRPQPPLSKLSNEDARKLMRIIRSMKWNNSIVLWKDVCTSGP